MAHHPRFRAWHFAYPVLDAPEALAGLQIAPQGGISMVQEKVAVRQAILLLLSTRPGERVMRPDYGCELYRLVFDPNDETTAGLAIHYVRRALDRWEPRIQILQLDATRNEQDPTLLDIFLEYYVRPTQLPDSLQFSLRMNEGITR
jgi:uncharacterized protein